mgnify:CR=1 FL=1
MTGRVETIRRYPIKSHGSQVLDAVQVTAGKTLPWDRYWAVAHEAAKIEEGAWAHCANFSRGSKAPALAAIRLELDEDGPEVTLTHPDLPALTFNPETESARFLAWVDPLVPKNRALPVRIVRANGRGMTDTPEPSISLNSATSHRIVEQKLGRDLSPLRWRGNFWIEGLGPWEEFEWIGKRIRIGAAEFEVISRIQRCLATTSNPDTGVRDADTLGVLENGWGHRDFGVYAVALTSGPVVVGDTVEVLG